MAEGTLRATIHALESAHMKKLDDILDRAVAAHTELMTFTQTALQGFGWATSALGIHELMQRDPTLRWTYDSREKHLQQAQKAQAFASDQEERGFPYLWYLASVRLWTILESMADDLTLETLRHHELLPPDSPLHELSGPLLTFLSAAPEQRAEQLTDLLKNKLRAGFKLGVGRLEALLDAVGLGGPVQEDVRRSLLELSQVRHLVVHKNGIVDRRFEKACPWVGLQVGHPLLLNEANFRAFSHAADWYIVELSERVWRATDKGPEPGVHELKESLVTALRRCRLTEDS